MFKKFFMNIGKSLKDFFNTLPSRFSRWLRGEVADFKRKTKNFPSEFVIRLKGRIGSMIVLVLVAIAVLVGYKAIQKAKGNAITYSKDYEAPEATANLLADGEYRSIAKNESLELLFCEEKGAVQIRDLRDGHLWKTISDEEVYSTKGINKQWAAYLQSPICISYNDLKKRDSGVKKVYAAKDCGSLEIEYIENGVAVTYGFLAPAIYVTVEYTIDGDEFIARIPWEKIREEWKYAMTTVELLPYFGACGNENDGYLFYPDGSGAITTFAKVGERSSSVKLASYYAYSSKQVSVMDYESDNLDKYCASMPVYGIKDGDHALFGYATEGAENTGVIVYPSGYVINLNHVGFELYTRNVFNVSMYNMSSEAGTTATGATIQRVDKNLIRENKEVRYSFLSGDKANYSGMAAAYREYLTEAGLLRDNLNENEGYPLALEILMGTAKEGILFDEYIAMTDFDQVKEIAEDLKESGVENSKVVLSDWVKKSEQYYYWGPERRLGGKSGLKSLGRYAAENGLDVFLQTSFARTTSASNNYEEDDDSVYDGLNIEIAAYDSRGYAHFLSNPLALLNRNNNFLKKLSKYTGLGVAYEYIGKFAYPDYNEKHPYTKTETVAEFRKALANTEEAGRSIAVRGANQYVYTYADYLYELSEKSFGLAITDYAVPFVQLVVSGYIPYSTNGAGNLSYDLPTQKLKWIEFGSLPYFYVTYESALNLRDTWNSTLFSSTWSDWKYIITDTYNEFRTNLSCVYGKQMTEHKIVSDTVSRVTYENGVKIYVNYADTEAVADGITIPAKGYVVTGGTR